MVTPPCYNPHVMWLTLVKAAVAIFFIVMFVRRSTLGWGVGLLTVTVAFLLDAFGTVFGRTTVLDTLGFFRWVVAGGLVAGGYVWLRSLVPAAATGAATAATVAAPSRPATRPSADSSTTLVDRKELYEQIRHNLGPDDVSDLVFDLGLNENDVWHPGLDMAQIIVNVMDEADAQGMTGMLAMAVERILTPVPKENLPRLSRLSADSPPTVLRQFLIANYDLDDLAAIAGRLRLDWQEMGDGPKKTRVRRLLLYVKRRGRLADLIAALQAQAAAEQAAASAG